MKKLLICILAVLSIAFMTAAVSAEAADDVSEMDVVMDDVELDDTDDVDVNSDPGEIPSGVSEADENQMVIRDDSGERMNEIVSGWEKNGYPGDVSYVFESGGELIETATDAYVCTWLSIGLVNADEARKAELEELFGSECSISFYDCKYTYSERLAAYDELQALKAGDDKIGAVVMLLNNEQIQVCVDPEKTTAEEIAQYEKSFSEKYGKMIWLSTEYSVATDDLDGGLPTIGIDNGLENIGVAPVEAEQKPYYFIAGIVFVAFALFITAFAVIRRRSAARQTADGRVIAGEKSLSKTDVVNAVKASEIKTDDALFKKIKQKLDE